MSLFRQMAEGLDDVRKINVEIEKRKKERDSIYRESFSGKVEESAFIGDIDRDGLTALVEMNRGRYVGSPLLDLDGIPFDNRVIAQTFQGGSLTAVSRGIESFKIHVYRLDIGQEIVTELNYNDFTKALFTLRDPVATPAS